MYWSGQHSGRHPRGSEWTLDQFSVADGTGRRVLRSHHEPGPGICHLDQPLRPGNRADCLGVCGFLDRLGRARFSADFSYGRMIHFLVPMVMGSPSTARSSPPWPSLPKALFLPGRIGTVGIRCIHLDHRSTALSRCSFFWRHWHRLTIAWAGSRKSAHAQCLFLIRDPEEDRTGP